MTRLNWRLVVQVAERYSKLWLPSIDLHLETWAVTGFKWKPLTCQGLSPFFPTSPPNIQGSRPSIGLV